YSDDDGATFTLGAELGTDNDNHNDPVVLVLDDGSFLAVWLGYDNIGGIDHIWAARSTDHGHSFGPQFAINDARTQGLDKPSVYQAPDAAHTIYVTYAAANLTRPHQVQSVYMVSSSDHGASWSEATEVSLDEHDSANLGCIASDGAALYV